MENETTISSPRNRARSAIVLVGMLLLAGIITVAILRDRIVNQPQWQVSFTGQGKVTFTPDIAKVNMGVQVDKKAKAEDALKELDEKMKKIYQAVEKLGIAKEDVEMQNYTLLPQYDVVNNQNKLTGYSANQVVIVKVKDIANNPDMTSKVVSAASQAGVNQINGIGFEPSDLNALKDQARLKAINDAKEKARELSVALGVKLGDIVGWWENYNPQPVPYYGDYGGGGIGGGAGGGGIIQSGSHELTLEVTINYKIK
jgi:uncharacterized protein